MTPLAAYLLLFIAVGVGFIFVHLIAGKLLRPNKKNAEKETIYECGEPTIGSAWIQFDLRFYVVALLFIIFDVEVAFFFPWAEVFGKANAIHSTPDPKTPAEYRDMANKILDLAVPPGSTSGKPMTTGVNSSEQERLLWTRLASLRPEDIEAENTLQASTRTIIRSLGDSRAEELRSINPEQVKLLQQHGTKLGTLVDQIVQTHKEEINKFTTSLDNLPEPQKSILDKSLGGGAAAPRPQGGGAVTKDELGEPGIAGLKTTLQSRPNQVGQMLRSKLLLDIQTMRRSEVNLMSLSPLVMSRLKKVLPAEMKAIDEMDAKNFADLTSAVNQALTDLDKTDPTKADLWKRLSIRWMKDLGDLDEKQLEAIRTLSPQTVTALQAKLVPGAKAAATSLAWMALVEILVFFGVLLVGFAYLWKRGDLAWVRSIQAEQADRLPAVRTEPRTQELQTTAQGN